MNRHKQEFSDQLSQLQQMLADKDLEIQALQEQCVDKERIITGHEQTIQARDQTIM